MQVLQKDPSDCFVQDEACGIRPTTEQAVKKRSCQSFWLSLEQGPTFPLCTISKPKKEMLGLPPIISSFGSGRPKLFGRGVGVEPTHIKEGATLLQLLLPVLIPNLSTQILGYLDPQGTLNPKPVISCDGGSCASYGIRGATWRRTWDVKGTTYVNLGFRV